MSVPHDAPSVAEMIEAVREWIESDVVGATDGRLRFHARVAANMLGMIERELELGGAQATAHRARLAAFGVEDDDQLARQIRSGEFDQRAAELRALLRADVVDKLLVANPGYLEPRDLDGASSATETG